MRFSKLVIAILLIFALIEPITMVFCEEGKVVGQVSTKTAVWYAIIKDIKTGKTKLYIKGDIIYSEEEITRCLRIIEIKEGAMLLEDLETKEISVLTPGEKVPLKDADKVFEKTVEASVLEYQYTTGDLSSHPAEDFTVKDLAEKKVTLGKAYKKKGQVLSEEERSLFDAPVKKNQERLRGEDFMAINFNKVAENEWEVDRASASSAIQNAEKVLFSIILSTQPRFRLKEGPSLDFTSELGNANLNREGFVIKNLAIAQLGARTGIREGDVIKRVNGQSVNSLLGIYRAYQSVKQNPEARLVKVEIMRNRRPVILTYRIR